MSPMKFERVLDRFDASDSVRGWINARGYHTLGAAWEGSYRDKGFDSGPLGDRGWHFRRWFIECLLDELEMWCEDTGVVSDLERLWNEDRWGRELDEADTDLLLVYVRRAFRQVIV